MAPSNEDALPASPERFRTVIDALPALVLVAHPDGDVDFVNRRWVEYTGISLERARLSGWMEAVHPDDRARIVNFWRSAVASNELGETEVQLVRADGVRRSFWLRTSRTAQDSQSAEWVATFFDVEEAHQRETALDVTEQMRARLALEAANAALRAKEHELNLMIDTIPGHIWCAAPDGRINYINKRTLELLGASFDEIASDHWFELIHAEDRETTLRTWAHAVATGSPYSFSLRLRGREGFHRWMQVMGQLGRDESGAPTRWYGLLIDIEEHKRAEAALSETRTRLTRASQAATVAELAASIAHEINQPLTGVVSNGQACSNWLGSDPPNVENARRAAEGVVRDVTYVGEVVSRLRTLFKRGPLNRVPLSMNELMSDVLDLLRSEAIRRRALIRTELDPNLPTVYGDRVQLQQVVLNLLNNALDAMDAILTRPKTLIVRSAVAPASHILVEVSDSGIGLDDPAKVFEPFYTTKSHGMGVGLAVSRSIIEAHEGRIWATKREPHGTSFAFTLPLAPDPTNSG